MSAAEAGIHIQSARAADVAMSTFDSCGSSIAAPPPPPTPVEPTTVQECSGAPWGAKKASSLPFVAAGIPLRGIGRKARILANMWRPITLVSSMLMGAFDLYVALNKTSSLRIVYITWSLSHFGRLLSLVSLQSMHRKQLLGRTRHELAASISNVMLSPTSGNGNPFDFKLHRPRACQIWIVLALSWLITVNTLLETAGNFWSDAFPSWVGNASVCVVAVSYVISHTAFVCGQALVLAAVEGALCHVEDSSLMFQTANVDWGRAMSEYMRLVRQLRSHCRFVWCPALLSFATLIVASVASGVEIWHNIRKKKVGLLLTLVQCSNFIVWSGLLLLLLNGFVSVNERVDATFGEKVRKGLMDHDTSPEDRRDMMSLFELMHRLEPAGWFLIGSGPLTRRIFNLSALTVVINLGAKAYDLIHHAGWVPPARVSDWLGMMDARGGAWPLFR